METMETNTAAVEKPGYKKTHFGWIPEEWEVVRLNTVARMRTGHTPSKRHPGYYDGGIDWVSLKDTHRLDNFFIRETTIQISEDGLRNSSAVLLPENTVVLSRTGSVGKSAILGKPMAVCQNHVAWTCGPKLKPEFLYFTLQSSRHLFKEEANGSTLKTIGLPFFEEFQIVLPSLEEQEYMTGIFVALDATITSTQNLLTAKRTYKRGLMQQLLTEQRRFPEFRGQPWREVKLGEVFGKKGLKNVGNRVSLVITVGKYAIRPQLSHFNRSVASSDLSAYNVIEPGDFVYDPMSAYYGAIGRYDLTKPGVVSPVYRVLTLEAGFNSDFIKQLLNSHYILNRLDNASTQGNKEGKRRGLQDGAFRAISFKCPPLPEQQRIAAVLSACDQELALLAAQLRQWQQQKQGLMQQLLTGRLRVGQGF